MHPTVSLHRPANLPDRQPKSHILKCLLHVPSPKHAQIPTPGCAPALGVLAGELGEFLGVVADLGLELVDVLAGLGQAAGDGLVAVGIGGVPGAGVFLEEVRAADLLGI